jgi:hypothetical protein
LIGGNKMKAIRKRILVMIVVVGLVASVFCSGCGLSLHPIYTSTMAGALIGGIIGYQSDEALAGALIGGAILGVGELLSQTDEMAEEQEQEEEQEEQSACREPQQDEKVVVEVTNSNGSITPVPLTKKGSFYVGPNGEAYSRRPTDQQLRPVYGL